MKRNKKTAKQKKILVASVILAVFIVAGGTFAWFTSKDEVTNKLTASNTYGVSIVESFSAPSNWIPGQEVNKDVYVANTGNIDAFVKTTISSALELTVEGEPVSTGNFNSDSLSSYVELSQADSDSMVDEVLAVQAGGRLVYYCDSNANGTLYTEESDIAVGTDFEPENTGLYIFERSAGSDSVEYTGYYYYTYTEGGNTVSKYYALASVDATLNVDNDITGFSAGLKTTKTAETADTGLTYDFDNVKDSKAPYITVTYTPENTSAIMVNIYLAADWATYWTLNKDEKAFYYNNTLEAGKATEKLIDYLELDESVEADAYINMVYDLTITTDSVQVTVDEEGKQTADAVNWSLSPELTYDPTDTDIISVSWNPASE